MPERLCRMLALRTARARYQLARLVVTLGAGFPMTDLGAELAVAHVRRGASGTV